MLNTRDNNPMLILLEFKSKEVCHEPQEHVQLPLVEDKIFGPSNAKAITNMPRHHPRLPESKCLCSCVVR
uniref:Uncharacterized protein n=1 Tax=Arundo donax TaxID=35708 RepID=A0A0A9B6J2_ARUDO